MSYILDALKKSEQQKRERDGDSGVDMTPLMMSTPPVADTPRLPVGVLLTALALVLLILVVGVLLWLPSGSPSILPVEPDRDALAVQSAAAQPPVIPSAVHSPGVHSPGVHSPGVQVPASVSKTQTQTQTAVVPVRPTPAVVTTKQLKSAPEPKTPKQVQTQAAPLGSETVMSPQRPKPIVKPVPVSAPVSHSEPVRTAEVDTTVVPEPRQPSVERRTLPPMASLYKIPDLIITSHIYSQDETTRSVSMNGRHWYEGEWIVPGVMLDKITETGILLDVDGFPFPVHRQNGWHSIAE